MVLHKYLHWMNLTFLQSHMWSVDGKKNSGHHRIPTQRKRQRVSLFGALNLVTQKFYWKSTRTGDAKSFMAFLNQLRQTFKGQQIHLILDNSSVHKNSRVKTYLERHQEVFLHFIPPYSPEYNPVEKVWWWIKPLVYGFSALKEGVHELLGRIRKLFWHYNEGRIDGALSMDLNPYLDIINILAD